jgi:hypothetical protein
MLVSETVIIISTNSVRYVSGGSGVTFGSIRMDVDKHQSETRWFATDIKSDSEK